MPVRYDRLPQSSSEFDFDDGSEFKRKRPRSHSLTYIFAILRKTRRLYRPLYILIFLVFLLVLQVTINTSYLHPPPFHPSADETVYIAANIIDPTLIDGAWGKSLLDLVDLIGKDRVYVSIYGGPTDALKRLEEKLPCEKSIVSEELDPIDLHSIQHTKIHTGESRIRRIAYLAEVRNRALKPLDSLAQTYNRILFLNDVFFSAPDAVRLLWGTNVNKRTGQAEYKAACGTDFVRSWKYYDTFATRDAEGYSMGVPIFPWFSNEGDARSRKDVLEQRSAVRVKSCWGGIVAFDGRYFQGDTAKAPRSFSLAEREESKAVQPPQLPIRFRSSTESFWEASECCLVHADLIASSPVPSTSSGSDPWDTGIYMNPYVRVSYDATTHSRLWIGKRFERLAAFPQRFINWCAKMPRMNTRRAEVEGDVVSERIWVPRNESETSSRRDASIYTLSDYPHATGHLYSRIARPLPPAAATKDLDFWRTEGHYIDSKRTAERGGYCGIRQLLVLREGPWENGNWELLEEEIPPLEGLF